MSKVPRPVGRPRVMADRDARVMRMLAEHPMSDAAVGRVFRISRQMVRKIRLREAQRQEVAAHG